MQLHLRGDDFPFGFANGHTLRNGASAFRFRYRDQTVRREGDVTTIVTTLAAPGGLSIEHRLTHHRGEHGVAVRSALINGGPGAVTL